MLVRNPRVGTAALTLSLIVIVAPRFHTVSSCSRRRGATVVTVAVWSLVIVIVLMSFCVVPTRSICIRHHPTSSGSQVWGRGDMAVLAPGPPRERAARSGGGRVLKRLLPPSHTRAGHRLATALLNVAGISDPVRVLEARRHGSSGCRCH